MTRKTIKLIAPDKNGILDYQGECKLTIDARFSKALIVEPKNKDYLDICAFFGWKFIQKKNLLFVFAELKIQDFVLIFANEEICQKVHDIIYKHKEEEKGQIQDEELRQRLLIPIFQKLPQKYSTRFKRVIIDWIEQHDENEKMELIKLYKKQKRNIQIMDIKNIKQEPNVINPRKRRFSKMENNDGIENAQENVNSTKLNAVRNGDDIVDVKSKRKKTGLSSIKIINESCFKIVNAKRGNGLRRKLLIFTSDTKTECYEYNFFPTKQFFNHKCHASANGLKAVLQLDEKGNECVKFENKPHVCTPLHYDTKKYFEMKILKKPDYEVLDNCATRSKKILIIFDSNDRNQCYEYYWSSFYKKFHCRGCEIKKRLIAAEICHENSENEYIRLLNDQHVCEIRQYDPKKYPESYNFVLSPNFEIQTEIKNGIEKQTLIIFNGDDRKMAYLYRLRTYFNNSFYCNGCEKKKKIVSARICQNNDGEDYVILSKVKHVCSPKEYISQEVMILRPPKIKFIEANETIKSRIIIFDSNDNRLCYIFSECFRKNTKRYYCLGCNNLTKTKCFVYLCKENENDGGEYYVKMVDNQKHICKPQKYEPEKYDPQKYEPQKYDPQKYEPQKYETKILKPKDDYIFFIRNVRNNGHPGLAIYDPNDKNLCYNFCHNWRKIFRCSPCQQKGTYISANIQHDSDGNEYIIMNQKKHVCKPINVSSIIKSETVILDKSGLSVEEEPKKKKDNEINENRIIRSPNFELYQNNRGVPERKLIVFCGDDKELFYEYRYQNDVFICKKCKSRAKLHHDPENDDEKYIILSNGEHTCEPVKYEAENKVIQWEKEIIESSDFIIFNRNDKSKPTKLITFTSSSKEFCYKYSFVQSNLFQCCGCNALKKTVRAKLMNNSNGEEYIQSKKNEHVCEPKNFILEEFQPKIVFESEFKLCPNRNGKENSKLILFDSEKEGFCYKYNFKNYRIFICRKCEQKKKTVTTKLCEKENGEKYLELSNEKHVCKSIKFDPEMLKKNSKMFGNFVVQHNIFGARNSRLTIFDENDKTFGYQFYLNQNYFRCCGCSTKNKSTLVKLKTDEEGNQYLECTKKTDHDCSIQNFKEENLIFYDFEFEENGNVLITNDSNKNGKYYKFKYDEESSGFCCIKCKKEKKKFITATVCNGNDGKEFVLLNNKHFCTALSK